MTSPAPGSFLARPGGRNSSVSKKRISAMSTITFAIVYSPEAVDHLAVLPKSTQALIVDQVDEQLTHEATLPTRKRKLLRPNPIAPWELRLGDIRVFYEVQEEPEPLVKIAAVGIKQHNALWIGKERIDL